MPVHERTNYYYPPSDVCSRYLMTLLYTFNVLLKEKTAHLTVALVVRYVGVSPLDKHVVFLKLLPFLLICSSSSPSCLVTPPV